MNRISIFIAGDTFLRTACEGRDPFERVREIRRGCRVAFCNLETVLTDRTRPAAGVEFPIRTDASNVRRLSGPDGFDVVSLANNHILNFGPEGLADTIAALDGSGIAHAGAGLTRDEAVRPAIVEADGLKVGFLALTYDGSVNGQNAYVMPLDLELARRSIELARRGGASIIVCSAHWGREFTVVPTPTQQFFGRGLIDIGADIVVGHHPHAVQGIESYKGKPIFYSLGNFNFKYFGYGDRDLAALGLMARIHIEKGEVVGYDAMPVRLNKACQPVPVEGEQAVLFGGYLSEISAPLGEGITWSYWMRNMGMNTLKTGFAARLEIIRRAEGIGSKLREITRGVTSLFSLSTLRMGAAALRSSLFASKKKHELPSALRGKGW